MTSVPKRSFTTRNTHVTKVLSITYDSKVRANCQVICKETDRETDKRTQRDKDTNRQARQKLNTPDTEV